MKLEQWPWHIPAPGIYFNMPFNEYLSIRCLSNSAVKDLLVHHANFWSKSWLNTRRKHYDSIALRDGRAYHKRILEGSAAFYEEYAEEYKPDPDDKDLIRDSVQLKEALRTIGEKVTFARKQDGINRLIKAYPAAKILEVEEAKHKKKNQGKEFIPYDLIYDIEMGAKAIESNQYLCKWIVGGYPEVTVIWYDEEYGVYFKCRFDYLKIGSCSDLKTIANERGRDFSLAINHEIASRKYIIQPSLYLRGAAAAQEHINAGRINGADNVPVEWLEAFIEKKVSQFRFIFQQKGDAVVTEGRTFSVDNSEMMSQGKARLQKASERFLAAYHHFGKELPWVGMHAPQEIDFQSLPSFIGDL